MEKQVRVIITPKGKIVTDFVGYEGKACFVDADKLAKQLIDLGVTLEESSVQSKTDPSEAITVQQFEKLTK